MGKRIIQRRRGRGTTTYRSHSFHFKADVKHRSYDQIEQSGIIKGKITDLINCPGHSAPIAQITYENNETGTILAPEKIRVNDEVQSGYTAEPKTGNTLPLKNIPDGTLVYNIETKPGDGGRLCRASGTAARIISHVNNTILVELPSRKQKVLMDNCRATIGHIAGTGRLDKPFVKAGNKHYAQKSHGKLYPRTSGVAMNAVDHPFGSGRGRHMGKPTTAPRFAPAGRKVGLIRARRTGRGK